MSIRFVLVFRKNYVSDLNKYNELTNFFSQPLVLRSLQGRRLEGSSQRDDGYYKQITKKPLPCRQSFETFTS